MVGDTETGPPLRRREIPHESTFSALFAPDPTFPFLEAASRLPFEATGAYSHVNAWWLSELSMLSYVDDRGLVRQVLDRVGLGPSVFLEEGTSFAFCAGDICVFRGTDEFGDLMKDLDVALAREGEARVHRGFQRALDLIWDGVLEALGDRPAVFAGHSLGGAMATLAAWRRSETCCAYTFGAPRVGGRQLREKLSTPVHRVVNNNDFVTRLPPPVHYRHAGSLQYIDETGTVQSDPERWERVVEQVLGHKSRAAENLRRWLKRDFEGIPYDSLVDHSPRHYAIHLWNHLLAVLEGDSPASR